MGGAAPPPPTPLLLFFFFFFFFFFFLIRTQIPSYLNHLFFDPVNPPATFFDFVTHDLLAMLGMLVVKCVNFARKCCKIRHFTGPDETREKQKIRTLSILRSFNRDPQKGQPIRSHSRSPCKAEGRSLLPT